MHAIAAISQSALAHNLSVARSLAPNSKIVCMVKADAYGHRITCSSPLFSADLLGVSELSEARHLRQFTNKPVLLLPGVFNKADLTEAVKLNCHLVLHDISQLSLIKDTALATTVWLKVDTGMHRLGLSISEFSACVDQLKRNSNIHIEAVMSHFACADDPNNHYNTQQIDTFTQLDVGKINRSMANSAAIFTLPKVHFDYIRPGIMLYGASPFGKIDTLLQPAMELSAPVISINKISSGESVGYGSTWQAKTNTTIATIGIGYADGYPRHAKNNTPVLIKGNLYPLAGRVSMDLICVDIGDSNIVVGDKAILWGHEKLRVETVANYSDTISYELLAGVSSRVNFVKHD